MIPSKRRAPTIDDLLRRQEEPQKRNRPSPTYQEHDDECGSADESDGPGEESSEGREPDVDELESGGEESTDQGTDSEFSQETPPVDPGWLGLSSESPDLLSSRVSVKPKIVGQRSQGVPSGAGSSKNVTFLSLNISPLLLSALSKMAIHAPTEIQRACIPPLLIGSNTCTIVHGYY